MAILTLNLPVEGYSRSMSCSQNWLSTFLFQQYFSYIVTVCFINWLMRVDVSPKEKKYDGCLQIANQPCYIKSSCVHFVMDANRIQNFSGESTPIANIYITPTIIRSRPRCIPCKLGFQTNCLSLNRHHSS